MMSHFMFWSDIDGPRWAVMGIVVKLAHSVSDASLLVRVRITDGIFHGLSAVSVSIVLRIICTLVIELRLCT